MTAESARLQSLKREIRAQAEANRRDQADKETLSRIICDRLAALPEYAQAATVMFYVDFRSEVRTRHLLPTALAHKQRVVVPYCAHNELGLFHLKRIDELAVGTYTILEPRVELRALADRTVDASELDLIVVPGVAFDRQGGRLGHGKGYYDRLLRHARPDTRLVALAFECQVFPKVPMQPHDVYMDKVVTEQGVYGGKGR